MQQMVKPEIGADGAVFCFSDYILSQIIGDELLEQLQPHRRVKRREKILPGRCRLNVGGWSQTADPAEPDASTSIVLMHFAK